MSEAPRVWVGESSELMLWHWLWEWDDDSNVPKGRWHLMYEFICPGELFMPGSENGARPSISPVDMSVIDTCAKVDWLPTPSDAPGRSGEGTN